MQALPKNKTLSAPLAGISDSVFCAWALRHGAGLVFSGMVSAEGLRRKAPKTLSLLDFDKSVAPLGIQLFDDDPIAMSEAAKIVQDSGFGLIDVNLGCPAKKVFRKGAGVSLLSDPQKAAELVAAVVSAVSIPVSAKIRTGIDDHSAFEEAIPRLVDAGASFITLHARSRKQGFSGTADWDMIARAVQISSVPIVGNGDIDSGRAALRMIESTGCAAVMIGRASLGNPWVFAEVSSAILGGDSPSAPSDFDRLTACADYVADMAAFYGDTRAGTIARKFVGWFTKGMARSKAIRAGAFKLENAGEVVEFLKQERESYAS